MKKFLVSIIMILSLTIPISANDTKVSVSIKESEIPITTEAVLYFHPKPEGTSIKRHIQQVLLKYINTMVDDYKRGQAYKEVLKTLTKHNVGTESE